MDFCIKNWGELISSCPALAAESRLFELRIRDPMRKPQVNDARYESKLRERDPKSVWA
jgi:hypothetical protein